MLVTGGSGFLGSHCILQLLERGYRVRTSLRSLAREGEVRAMLEASGADPGERLSFVAADLSSDAHWSEAVAGCDFVLHVASPLPSGRPRHADELIVPARDGALRLLRAARDAGVRRVVLTSSYVAAAYGREPTDRPLSEECWTDPERSGVSAYAKSKTLAERAAWDFMAREGGELELSVVNPVVILGPVLGPDYSTSILIVKRLMEGSIPGCPRLSLGLVDVRDVADLQLRAMTDPSAGGERFLAAAGPSMAMLEIARVLKARMGDAARRVPTGTLPDWILRLAALFDTDIAEAVPELGRERNVSSEKARRLLGWAPRPNEDSIVATAESLLRFGLLRT